MVKGTYRTTVYVDGFNFYYGEVLDTPYQWLNLPALFQKILGPQNRLTKLKYFTARVKPTTGDPEAAISQDAYFRALKTHSPLTELHFGHFLRHKVRMEHVNPPPSKVMVWKNEEKGSDVNLALHVLNDAWRDNYDCAVIVSNDSDLAEALGMVKAQHQKLIGLVTPGAPRRKTSRELRIHVDFVKPVRTWMLKSSQFPDRIPGTNIYKPPGW